MDPKLSNLDPKLQDAYHRVMGSAGANIPQQQQPQQAPQSVPQPTYSPPTPPSAPIQAQTPPPAGTQPPAPVSNPEPPKPIETSQSNPSGNIPGVNSTMAFNAEDSHRNVGTTPVKKGGFHIMPLVVGLGIMILLVAYTFVWIMLFNVQVPFLPQL